MPELIGSGQDELFRDSRWLSRFGVPLIIRKAVSRADDSLCWPSCQDSVCEKGRKVDFVLAARGRVSYKWPHTAGQHPISAVMPFCWIKPVSLPGCRSMPIRLPVLTSPDQQTFRKLAELLAGSLSTGAGLLSAQ